MYVDVNLCMHVTVCLVGSHVQTSVIKLMNACRLLAMTGAHTDVTKNHQHATNCSKCNLAKV